MKIRYKDDNDLASILVGMEQTVLEWLVESPSALADTRAEEQERVKAACRRELAARREEERRERERV